MKGFCAFMIFIIIGMAFEGFIHQRIEVNGLNQQGIDVSDGGGISNDNSSSSPPVVYEQPNEAGVTSVKEGSPNNSIPIDGDTIVSARF